MSPNRTYAPSSLQRMHLHRCTGQSWSQEPVHVGGGVSIIRKRQRAPTDAHTAAPILLSESGHRGETKSAALRLAANQDASPQRSSPELAVGVVRHRALQRVGATGETKKAAQRFSVIRRRAWGAWPHSEPPYLASCSRL